MTTEPTTEPVERWTPTVVDAIRDGILDDRLAGLLWVLIDGGVPLVVAAPGTTDGAGRRDRSGVLEALRDLVPSARKQLTVDGATEDFRWLADAEGLGWVRSTAAEAEPADPRTTTLLTGELGPTGEAALTGDRVRLVIRALGRGYGLAATIQAGGLEEVLAKLRRRPVFLTDDELSTLGVVVVVGPGGDERSDGNAIRIVAAHYVRPLARDVHGHTQRLPPAVLATWDERVGRFEHFAWGIAAELALRVGRRTGDFESEADRRAAVLAALAADLDDRSDRPRLRADLERQRALGNATSGLHRH